MPRPQPSFTVSQICCHPEGMMPIAPHNTQPAGIITSPTKVNQKHQPLRTYIDEESKETLDADFLAVGLSRKKRVQLYGNPTYVNTSDHVKECLTWKSLTDEQQPLLNFKRQANKKTCKCAESQHASSVNLSRESHDDNAHYHSCHHQQLHRCIQCAPTSCQTHRHHVDSQVQTEGADQSSQVETSSSTVNAGSSKAYRLHTPWAQHETELSTSHSAAEGQSSSTSVQTDDLHHQLEQVQFHDAPTSTQMEAASSTAGAAAYYGAEPHLVVKHPLPKPNLSQKKKKSTSYQDTGDEEVVIPRAGSHPPHDPRNLHSVILEDDVWKKRESLRLKARRMNSLNEKPIDTNSLTVDKRLKEEMDRKQLERRIKIKKREEDHQRKRLIKKFTQVGSEVEGREHSNTFSALLVGKPPFCPFGAGNISPMNGGLIYGDYLLSHNVSPERKPHKPATMQVYRHTRKAKERMLREERETEGKLLQQDEYNQWLVETGLDNTTNEILLHNLQYQAAHKNISIPAAALRPMTAPQQSKNDNASNYHINNTSRSTNRSSSPNRLKFACRHDTCPAALCLIEKRNNNNNLNSSTHSIQASSSSSSLHQNASHPNSSHRDTTPAYIDLSPADTPAKNQIWRDVHVGGVNNNTTTHDVQKIKYHAWGEPTEQQQQQQQQVRVIHVSGSDKEQERQALRLSIQDQITRAEKSLFDDRSSMFKSNSVRFNDQPIIHQNNYFNHTTSTLGETYPRATIPVPSVRTKTLY